MLDELELTGRARTHVEQCVELGAAIHRQSISAVRALKGAAASEGIDLKIVSGFRDFGAQLKIWNAKYAGERTLYDEHGTAIDASGLDAVERIECILRWSALPGASRHHWGTEIDVIDAAALPPTSRYQLLPVEYAPGGMFHPLNKWLDQNIARFGFFRPYAGQRGGVCPEPWHLSYTVIAAEALSLLTEDLLARTLAESDILGKAVLLNRLPLIYRSHVLNISPSPDTEE